MEYPRCGLDGSSVGEAECLVAETEAKGGDMVEIDEWSGREDPREDARGVFEGGAGFGSRGRAAGAGAEDNGSKMGNDLS
jgi:hypothetical protein